MDEQINKLFFSQGFDISPVLQTYKLEIKGMEKFQPYLFENFNLLAEE